MLGGQFALLDFSSADHGGRAMAGEPLNLQLQEEDHELEPAGGHVWHL